MRKWGPDPMTPHSPGKLREAQTVIGYGEEWSKIRFARTAMTSIAKHSS